MATFLIGTDGVPDAEVLWISRSIAVLSGGSKYRRKFDRVAPGDRLAMWVEGVGFCALGTVLTREVATVKDERRVNLAEPEEYHLPTAWEDCRDFPVTYADAGIIPNASFKQLIKHEARVLAWFAERRAVPVADRDDCDRRAEALLGAGPVLRPPGNATPGVVPGGNAGRYRCPKVRAWTLQRAGHQCELCNRPAFFKRSGRPYLESHHIVHLASDGPDTPENTAAVCANCHRELHHGHNAPMLTETLLRLVAEKEAPYIIGQGMRSPLQPLP